MDAASFYIVFPSGVQSGQVNFICDSNLFFLKHTYFYQILSKMIVTAMGTIFSPSFIKIKMADWESKFAWNDGKLDATLLLWKQYFDYSIFI